ncbi:winged helix-turn-helix transcriptional regulator [Lentisalinibacter orientalis]|uniref:winged helix-turn-helix transcriptional regulator n=1 Tax=Lentisalinibacter orientalis TaxID=2992241 RepID=UPI003865A0CE
MVMEDRILKGSVRRALDEIGDRWTLLILLSAFCDVERFDDWKVRFGISPSILSSRLKKLVTIGILTKQPVGKGARRLRYMLTDKGADLFLWALSVWDWESVWIYRDSDHPVQLQHTGCGHRTRPRFACTHCGKRVSYDNVIIERGPGYDDVMVSETPDSRRSSTTTEDNDNEIFLGRSVDTIGDRWSFLVISAAYFGVTRFDNFQSQLDIASNILSDRLRHLANHGMLARNRYQERPARYEYILTEKTIAYYNVPLMLALWGDKWLPTRSGLPFLRYHETCGHALGITPYCQHCDEELVRGEVRFITPD